MESASTNESLQWLLATLGQNDHAEPGRYYVRPSAADPQFFIPLANRLVARRSFVRHHDDRSTKDRLTAAAAQAVALAGGLGHAPGDVIELPGLDIVFRIQQLLGEPLLWPAITIGPARRNRKPVLQLLTPDGVTAAFAKLGWSKLTRELVSNEAKWLKNVDGHLPAGLEAPSLLASVHLPADPTQAAEKTQPTTERTLAVATGLARPIWPPMAKPLTRQAIVELARCLGTWRGTAGDLPHMATHLSVVPPDLAARFNDVHGDAMVEFGLWHGDLTPWNTSSGGSSTRIWDWEFAGDNRPIGFDLLHITFEKVRRTGGNKTPAALGAVIESAPDALIPLGQPVDAVLDLYFLELLHRESRLAVQDANHQWESPVGALTPHLLPLLTARLNRRQDERQDK